MDYPVGMARVEDLPDSNHTLNSIAKCQTSDESARASDTHAVIRGFGMVFERLTKSPGLIRLLLQAEFKFIGVVNAYVPGCNHGELLAADWFDSVFVIPHYSDVSRWMHKCSSERDKGRTVVSMLPSRTNTGWFHEYVLGSPHNEVRFVRGRITMPGFTSQSPYPDAICIFRPGEVASESEGGHLFSNPPRSVAIMTCSTSIVSDETTFTMQSASEPSSATKRRSTRKKSKPENAV